MSSVYDNEYILVTGGLGYIGSHIVIKLLELKYNVVILDNLCNSDIKVLSIIETMIGHSVPFFNCDIRDRERLENVFKSNKLTGVIHLAGKKSVPESVDNPGLYYDNNVNGSNILIDLSLKYGIEKFIFSSSASVYGDKIQICKEDEKYLNPISPYASTKLTVEQILNYSVHSKTNTKTKAVSLRYFNPVGGHKSGKLGDFSNLTEFSNLFKVIESIAIGIKEYLSIYGCDYNTIDGTPVRDYVHVEDIAEGHVKMLSYFDKNNFLYDVFNMGTEKGNSVKEVIDCYNKSNGINLKYLLTNRRSGDVESITSDCNKIYNAIEWKAKRSLEEMCVDSYNFAIKNYKK